jgi:hypothetical protein
MANLRERLVPTFDAHFEMHLCWLAMAAAVVLVTFVWGFGGWSSSLQLCFNAVVASTG